MPRTNASLNFTLKNKRGKYQNQKEGRTRHGPNQIKRNPKKQAINGQSEMMEKVETQA
jgi:hypothetical protein